MFLKILYNISPVFNGLQELVTLLVRSCGALKILEEQSEVSITLR